MTETSTRQACTIAMLTKVIAAPFKSTKTQPYSGAHLRSCLRSDHLINHLKSSKKRS